MQAQSSLGVHLPLKLQGGATLEYSSGDEDGCWPHVLGGGNGGG